MRRSCEGERRWLPGVRKPDATEHGKRKAGKSGHSQTGRKTQGLKKQHRSTTATQRHGDAAPRQRSPGVQRSQAGQGTTGTRRGSAFALKTSLSY
ncbi:hypothetical protein SKAU_G00308180 [Synaphobranchus kaupii]|uniref:Uncharacterized protein n=1 Tax=Synaphobranchus kaupii TaxID=118154 RepID=A0A9Q1EQZ8_SYNKA|nr:hypothetical protein SKAU_G00308180 [Synaphobranchus kaupii]